LRRPGRGRGAAGKIAPQRAGGDLSSSGRRIDAGRKPGVRGEVRDFEPPCIPLARGAIVPAGSTIRPKTLTLLPRKKSSRKAAEVDSRLALLSAIKYLQDEAKRLKLHSVARALSRAIDLLRKTRG